MGETASCLDYIFLIVTHSSYLTLRKGTTFPILAWDKNHCPLLVGDMLTLLARWVRDGERPSLAKEIQAYSLNATTGLTTLAWYL